jgi:hypothetical protein
VLIKFLVSSLSLVIRFAVVQSENNEGELLFS